MIYEGQIVLFKFPHTDQKEGVLRPALIIRKLPGEFNDWLVCMISSKLRQQISDLDEIITPVDQDFNKSGLKVPIIIRINRLAVVNGNIFLGKLGQIDSKRLKRTKQKLVKWIQDT